MMSFSSPITITEEGEAIGTLQQFARSFNLSVSCLLHVLDTTAQDCVIFRAGSTPERVLILDSCGLPVLFATASRGT